jgi:hypothetical protein
MGHVKGHFYESTKFKWNYYRYRKAALTKYLVYCFLILFYEDKPRGEFTYRLCGRLRCCTMIINAETGLTWKKFVCGTLKVTSRYSHELTEKTQEHQQDREPSPNRVPAKCKSDVLPLS